VTKKKRINHTDGKVGHFGPRKKKRKNFGGKEDGRGKNRDRFLKRGRGNKIN